VGMLAAGQVAKTVVATIVHQQEHGRPTSCLTDGRVDLVQEWVDLSSLGQLCCSSCGEPPVCVFIHVVGLFFGNTLSSEEAGEVVSCQVVN